MSRKSSSIYDTSSFDAIESTRRLSEEISSSMQSETIYKEVPNGIDRNDELNRGCENSVVDENDINNADGFTPNVESDANNNRFEKRLQEIRNNCTGVTSSSSLEQSERFSISTSKRTSVNTGDDPDVIEENGDVEGNSNFQFDQRSVSDSDLDSPDDFDEGGLRERSDDGNNRKDTNLDRRQSQESYTCRKSQGFQGPTPETACITNNDDGADYNHNAKNDTASLNKEGQTSLSDRIGNASDNERIEYAQLTQEEIDSKMRDDDVIRQGELLDTVREVGVTNLNKLQHLKWNDPALRRLFMRQRINKTEVSTVKIDPDIKNTVNEFLKTNVTENFMISRVLRENYATFYSWLSSHLQTERNAWTTRLIQALENADNERKSSLQCRNLVVESAARLRMLVKTSSNILFGIPDKDDATFFKTDKRRRTGKRDIDMMNRYGRRFNIIGNGFTVDTNGYLSDSNAERVSGRFRRFRQTKRTQVKNKKHLAPSNFRLVQVSNSKCEHINYDSDPGENITEWQKRAEDDYGGEVIKDEVKMQTKQNEDNKKSYTLTTSEIENNNIDCDSVHSGYNLEGFIIEDDRYTDWNQALIDSIEVLTDICDTLLMDRKSCFQIMKVNPKRCESLVDAVSNLMKNKHSEINSKRDIEKRFRSLEHENRALQEEMGTLHKTLADKSRDALNLQCQLDRLENIMSSYSVPKVNKCVGTNEDMFPAVFKNNLTVGGSKTPRQNNQSTTNTPKLSRTPRTEKEIKNKTVELPSVNGTGNLKHLKHNREFHSPNLLGATKNLERRPSQEMCKSDEPTATNGSLQPHPQPSIVVREPSLIEISEEKLKTLKQRARKLEDSLHDAITSMERLNKSTQESLGTTSANASLASMGSLYNKNLERNGPKTFKKWQKASFEVNSKPPEGISGKHSTPTPRVAVIKRTDSYYSPQHTGDNNGNPKNQDYQLLVSEPSSLLEGRAILSAPREGAVDRTLVSSDLRISSEKLNYGRAALRSSRSTHNDDCKTQSDDDLSQFNDSDCINTYRRQPDQTLPGNTSTPSQSQQQSKQSRRVRARHNASRFLGGKQTVSKCLRCQKLFSPTDNHKLACCYHKKDKERLEHYDNSGMLIRVIYAWKCCHQPQEAEGCCYGQHV